MLNLEVGRVTSRVWRDGTPRICSYRVPDNLITGFHCGPENLLAVQITTTAELNSQNTK